MKLFTFAWALALVCTVQAQSNPWHAERGLTSAQFQNKSDSLTTQGFRLNYVSGYTLNNDPRFAAIWEKNASVPWVARIGLNATQLEQNIISYNASGYRIILVNGYTVNGVDYYAGIWDQSPSEGYVFLCALTIVDYEKALATYSAISGFRLRHVSGYAVGDSARFCAIWDQTNASYTLVTEEDMTASDYETESSANKAKGLRLVLVSGYQVDSVDYYVAIWDSSPSGPWADKINLTSSEYQTTYNSYVSQGYTLKIISGYDIGQTDLYAVLWVK